MIGRVATTNEEVNLRILHAVKYRNLIKVASTFGPEFEGDYKVTDTPPPLVTLHGDILFDLTKIIS